MSCEDQEVDCSEVLNRLYDFLDRELDVRTLTYADITKHLDGCHHCLTEYDVERAIRAVLARSCGCEQAPEELRTRVQAHIRDTTL